MVPNKDIPSVASRKEMLALLRQYRKGKVNLKDAHASLIKWGNSEVIRGAEWGRGKTIKAITQLAQDFGIR